MVNKLWIDWIAYLDQGGIVMWPMVVGTIVLWYALGYRMIFLQRGSKLSVRKLIEKFRSNPAQKQYGYIDRAAAQAIEVRKNYSGKIDRLLEDKLFSITEAMGKYRALIRTIVLVAPLAGLLGTVSGMIEMFESLGSQAFYSQSGGVANGISQALFTTQFGLVIAIPGLIFGNFLDHRENKMKEEIEQIKDYMNADSGEVK